MRDTNPSPHHRSAPAPLPPITAQCSTLRVTVEPTLTRLRGTLALAHVLIEFAEGSTHRGDVLVRDCRRSGGELVVAEVGHEPATADLLASLDPVQRRVLMRVLGSAVAALENLLPPVSRR